MTRYYREHGYRYGGRREREREREYEREHRGRGFWGFGRREHINYPKHTTANRNPFIKIAAYLGLYKLEARMHPRSGTTAYERKYERRSRRRY